MKKSKKHSIVALVVLILVLSMAIFAGCKPDDDGGGHNTLPKITTYKVTFIDGAETFKVSDKLAKNSKLTPPTSPEKIGYVFNGWFKDDSFEEPWRFDEDVVTSNIKLYADWVENGLSQDCEFIYENQFTYDEDNDIFIKLLNNENKNFLFSENIMVSQKAKYKVYRNSACNIEAENEVMLKNGDNFFYLKVTAEEDRVFKIYTLNIRSTPKYKVTFQTYDNNTIVIECGENEKIVEPTVSYKGHTLLCWRVGIEGTTNVKDWDFEKDIVETDIRIYAVWEKNTYNITFDDNGGSYDGLLSVSVKYGTAPSGIKFDVPKHQYGHFAGWYYETKQITDENGQGVSFWEIDANVQLIAKWDYFSYNVLLSTENENMGSVSGGGEVKYLEEVTITATPNVGYRFLKWVDCNTGLEVSTESNFTFTLNSPNELKICAYFELISFTLTADYNYGDGNDDYNDEPQPIGLELNYGDVVSLPIPEGRIAFRFIGWGVIENSEIVPYTDEEGNLKSGQSTWTQTEDITIFAMWEPNIYSLNIFNSDINAGLITTNKDSSLEASTLPYGAMTLIGKYGEFNYGTTITIGATNNDSFDFIGWAIIDISDTSIPLSELEIYSYLNTVNVNLTNETYIVALWDNKSIEVSFDCNGGELYDIELPFYIKHNQMYTLPIPERDNYVFNGWYNDETKLTNDNGESILPLDSLNSISVVAKWSPKDYTIEIKSNNILAGNVTSNPTIKAPYGTVVKLTATINLGYTFDGWFYYGETESVSTDAVYEFLIQENVEIEACFSANTYNLSYDRNYQNSINDEPYVVTFGEDFTLMQLTSSDRPVNDNQYEFLGWYALVNDNELLLTDEIGVGKFKWNIAEDITVYAKWKSIFTVANRKITALSSYGKSLEDIVIPDIFNGEDITGIASNVFAWNNNIKTITISANVATIEANAFANCNNLSSVVFNNASKLNTIGASAFANCISLTSLILPRNATTLSQNCLSGCNSLQTLAIPGSIVLGTLFGSVYSDNSTKVEQGGLYYYIPNSLTTINITNSSTYIANYAYSNCIYVENITIPTSVTSIENSAFFNCISLESFSFENISYIGSNAFNKSGVKNTGVLSVSYLGTGAFAGSKLESVDFGNCEIDTISKSAFMDCNNLTSINNINGKNIEAFAFYGCLNLSDFNGADIKIVGDNAFYNTKLSEISVQSFADVKQIGFTAFHNTEWFNAQLSDSLIYVGKVAYYYATNNVPEFNTETISIASGAFSNVNVAGAFDLSGLFSLISVGSEAFYGSNIKEIILPDSVKAIGPKAFANCVNLINFNMGNGVKTLGYNAFADCTSLNNITLSTALESIGAKAFYNCKAMTEIILPNGLRILESGVFENCISLTEVIFGHDTEEYVIEDETFKIATSKVTEIKENTFKNNKALQNIDLPNSITAIGNSVFEGCINLATISFERKLKHGESSVSTEDMAIISTLGNSVFKDCVLLNNIVLPSSVKTIGKHTFDGCVTLEMIDVSNVTILEDYLFNNCISLSTLKVSNSLRTIGDSAFYNCQGLYSFVLPTTTTLIGDSAFANCANLVSVTIPAGSLEIIGERAFMNCSLLSSINISNNVTMIKSEAFSGCSSLTSLNISADLSKVKSIGESAFYGCSGLTSLVLPNSLEFIYSGAFENCINLNYVELKAEIKVIGTDAFKNCISLISVKFKGTLPPSLGLGVFDGCDDVDFNIYVLAEYVENFKNQNGWETYIDKIIEY